MINNMSVIVPAFPKHKLGFSQWDIVAKLCELVI